MSINTMAKLGFDSTSAIASFPVVAVSTSHTASLQNAAECENVPGVVVHQKYRFADEILVRAVQALEHPLLFLRQVGNDPMQE